ncbi:ABC transporter ATP-binding protein [Desulfatiferula olefinivorans]
MIRILNLSKSYKNFSSRKANPAVENLCLTVESGESFGFLGPNGAGKSTVIKMMMDFIRCDKGSLLINEQSVCQPSVRKNIGFLPENPLFFDHLSADEILRFGGRVAGMDGAVLDARIDMLLDRMLLTQARHKPLRTYSKGMVQRTGLALAMVHDPALCILDEPMSGLDPMGRKLVADVILDMRRAGKTIFFSSHILSDVEKLCDRVGVLNKGKLLFCGPIDELKAQTGDIEQSFVKLVEDDNRARS